MKWYDFHQLYEEEEEEEVDQEEVDKEKKDEEDEVEEQEMGFGGIKLSSVEDIIAKARMTETFMNIPTAGLSDNLTELGRLVEEIGDNGEHTPWWVWSINLLQFCISADRLEEREGERDMENDSKDLEGELSLEGIDDEEIEQVSGCCHEMRC